MKIYYSLFLATATINCASAFSVQGNAVTPFSSLESPRKIVELCMAEDDGWYSDYDETQFNAPSSSYGGGGGYSNDRRGGGGGRGGGYSGGGGYGGGHDYTRDTYRDNSNVDEDAVNTLLAERVQAKKTRDFDTADAIRDQLMTEYSVGVFDRERTWRTGCSNSGSGMKGRGRGNRPRKAKDFGPNGHDYLPSEDAGPINALLTEPEIHEKLAARLEAKMSRDFDVADGIQSELIECGVFVHDGLKEWRADGVPYGDFNGGRGPGRTAGSRNDRNRDYVKSGHSPDVEGAEDKLIDALVKERLKYKITRDYDKADAIREGLRSKFNVMIDDRLREWSVGGDFGEEHNAQRELADAFNSRGYIKSTSSLPLSPEEEEAIQEKIEERLEAKKNRDYNTADAIRDELQHEFDVTIHDKLKQWSVGGDFGIEGGKPRKERGVYTRRGGGDLSEEDIETITQLLSDRYKAKKDRDFYTADGIRDHLRETYNVAVDDKSSEWHVDSNEYVQNFEPGAKELSPEDVEIISARLVERFSFKVTRDYESADAIREELFEEYGVLIDDRTKEWRCVTPAEGNSDVEDDSFVEA